MRLRLRDERLEVLARAAEWSVANLAARLRIDVPSLRALRPDRDSLPGGGLEVVCDLFGLSEDEYSFFSPYVPVDRAPRRAFVRARAEGLARARAAIAKREEDRQRDFVARLIRGVISAKKHRLGHDRHGQMLKLLAKVDTGLRGVQFSPQSFRPPIARCRRWRGHFHAILGMMSLAGLDRLVRNVKRIRFFESVEAMNTYCEKRRFKDKDDHDQYDGMWGGATGTLYLGDDWVREDLFCFQRVTVAHELTHALDHHPISKGIRISDSTQWHTAWATEIVDANNAPLTEYATRNPCEGFAEFGALALTNPVFARRAFPKCWAVWRQHHLDADEVDTAAASDLPAVAAQPLGMPPAVPASAATVPDGSTAA